MAKFRKKPVVIEARQWLGGDHAWLTDFCGFHWTRADVHDMAFDDPEQVIVYNTAERQWLQVPVGHWIIRGIQGELYPCKPDIFAATYEPGLETDAGITTEPEALVERVAKAMYEATDPTRFHLVPWEKYHGRGREYWLAMARVAVREIAVGADAGGREGK
jgi:hypothetical protein